MFNVYIFQAEDKTTIQFDFIRLFLSCSNQWVKLRDGDSTASNLLAHLEGTPDSINPIISTGPNLLVEFFSSVAVLSSGDCFGGFFAQINRIGQWRVIRNQIFLFTREFNYFCFLTDATNRSQPNSTRVDLKNHFEYLMSDIDSFLATVSAILLFLLVTCMCFTVQFAERKHKYHKAVTTMDKHSNSTRTLKYFSQAEPRRYIPGVPSHTQILENINFFPYY